MPFDLSGSFSRLYTWATEAQSPPIATSKLDTQEEDFASALSNCVLRDGTGKPTADMDFNGRRITNLGAATASTDAVSRTYGDTRYGVLIRAYKTADETVTGSTTLQNDDHLLVSMDASTRYAVQMYLRGGWGALGTRFKLAFTLPSGAASYGMVHYATSGDTTDSVVANLGSLATSYSLVSSGSSNGFSLYLTGFVETAATAGSLQLQWAQVVTTGGGGTTVYENSWLSITRLGAA